MADLMTVGELAKRVGVTVRTVQYYDQKGLLHPSQIGPANQRLYSEDDEREMRRILVLKYLGLSLADIARESRLSKDDFLRQVKKSQERLSNELLQLFERMSALNALSNAFDEEAEIDWAKATKIICLVQSSTETFWDQVSGSNDEGVPAEGIPRGEVMEWHALMGQTIEAIQQGVDPSSERGRDLGNRFLELGGRERALQGFGRMGESGQIRQAMDDRSRAFLEKVQNQVLNYLEKASAV